MAEQLPETPFVVTTLINNVRVPTQRGGDETGVEDPFIHHRVHIDWPELVKAIFRHRSLDVVVNLHQTHWGVPKVVFAALREWRETDWTRPEPSGYDVASPTAPNTGPHPSAGDSKGKEAPGAAERGDAPKAGKDV